MVFQLGGDQICIMDPQKRKIAMIAKGKGPIVAEPKTSSKAVQATAASAVPGVSACSARKCEDSVAAGEWYVRETVLHTVTVPRFEVVDEAVGSTVGRTIDAFGC